jgi:hypothetical protein
MPLDVKKIYIDTRYKTDESRSDSDFIIDLPRTLNVPENCVCFLDDFVIPVSWSTVDERNNRLYLHIVAPGGVQYKILTLPSQNYSGLEFADALKSGLNDITKFFLDCRFDVFYLRAQNKLTITQISGIEQVFVTLVSSADLKVGKLWSGRVANDEIHSMNGILRLGKVSKLVTDYFPYVAYIDLYTTRNLYLTSSALACYSNISNFKNDIIVKKLPVNANYGEMMFYNASVEYDYLDVSMRSLSRIDFRLQDSYGNLVDLKGNHFSFSLVFREKL